jgi:hypothetical protein
LTDQSVNHLAWALRRVREREVRHLVIEPAEPSPYFVQFTSDPGVFWGEVVSDQYLDPPHRLGPKGAARLAALAWRAPAAHIPNWFQYFTPERKRHHRQLAEHVLATFREALRYGGELVTRFDESPPAGGPTFVLPEHGLSPDDRELLVLLEQVMAGFPLEDHGDHLEVSIRRGRHDVRLGISAFDGTLSIAALHLPAVEQGVLEAALTVNDELDRVPYTYAVRTVAGHGDSLVLLTKFAVLPEQRLPWLLGMLLYGAIEPLVAAHRALHRGAWGDRAGRRAPGESQETL